MRRIEEATTRELLKEIARRAMEAETTGVTVTERVNEFMHEIFAEVDFTQKLNRMGR